MRGGGEEEGRPGRVGACGWPPSAAVRSRIVHAELAISDRRVTGHFIEMPLFCEAFISVFQLYFVVEFLFR